jgi:hypothetical protein
MGIVIGDDKTTSFDFKTDDFTSAMRFFHGLLRMGM